MNSTFHASSNSGVHMSLRMGWTAPMNSVPTYWKVRHHSAKGPGLNTYCGSINRQKNIVCDSVQRLCGSLGVNQ